MEIRGLATTLLERIRKLNPAGYDTNAIMICGFIETRELESNLIDILEAMIESKAKSRDFSLNCLLMHWYCYNGSIATVPERMVKREILEVVGQIVTLLENEPSTPSISDTLQV